MTRAQELREWLAGLPPEKRAHVAVTAEGILDVHREAYREAHRRYVSRHGPQQHGPWHRSCTHQRALDKRWRQDFLLSGTPCQHCGGNERLEVSHLFPLRGQHVPSAQIVQWLCHECHVRYDRTQRREAMMP